jgi:hypothetical protein
MSKNKPQTEDIKSRIIGFFEDSLSEVFDERKGFYLSCIQNRLSALLNGLPRSEISGQNGHKWEEIDSLSKLRSLVGGRFQNLKVKWLGAGFPLKQDKGSKPAMYTLNEPGWLELSSWISNQGFEVRRNSEKKDVIFEIKQTN